MRVISKVRDFYDYLCQDRDPHARIYTRDQMYSLVEDHYIPISAKTPVFKTLETRDATQFLTDLLIGHYKTYKYSTFKHNDRICLLVVGTQYFVLAIDSLHKLKADVRNVTDSIKDLSAVANIDIAGQLRKEANIGPVLAVELRGHGNDRTFMAYIPKLEDIISVLKISAKQVVQNLENALIEDNPDPAMPDISDKDRLVQHGFDPKSSFRNVTR